MDQATQTTRQLDALLESVSDWIWEIDAEGRFTYCSPQVESMLGYAAESLIGLTFLNLLPAVSSQDFNRKFLEIFEAREPFDFFRVVCQHRNSSLVLLEKCANPFFDELGNFAGYRGIDRNLSANEQRADHTSVVRELLNFLDEAGVVCSRDGRIIQVNQAFSVLFGYSSEEVVGRNISFLNPESATDRQSTDYSIAALESNASINLVRERRRKDGTLVSVLIRGKNVKGVVGAENYFLGTYENLEALDVQSSRFAELNRNEILLEQAQAIAHIGGWELNLVSGELYWTAETYRIHETSADKFNPTLDAGIDFYTPESQEILKPALDAAINEGKGYDLFLDLNTVKGNRIHVRTTCEVSFKEGKPEKLLGAFQDITELVEKDRFLNLSLKENALAVREADLGLWVFDVEANRLEWNDVQYRLYGVSKNDFKLDPANWDNLVLADNDVKAQAWLQAVSERKDVKNHKFSITLLSGEKRKLSGSATAIFERDGKLAKLIGINRDITKAEASKKEIRQLVRDLKQSLEGTIDLVMELNDLRDAYTAGHEYRVGVIAGEIAKVMGLGKDVVEGLQQAGKLHDIGKFAVPLAILSKPGKLSAAEFELVKGHSQAGYDVLKRVKFPWPVAEIALQHHERMDGSGYPQGLKGDAILLESRILGVADVVEAMASHRPYRPQLGLDVALDEIEKGRGTRYDARVVDACLTLFRERNFQIPVAQ